MTFLRHAPRHVHHSVADYITTGLAELGWTSALDSERPFGAEQIKVTRTHAITDGRRVAVTANTVAITLGSEASTEDLELGGALVAQDYPVFVDVLMDEDALALSLATDIRDHLLGRFEFSRRFIDVVDQATRTLVPGWRLALDDVERIRPENDFALHWQVVKVTATAEFLEARY